jgi:hypothetical protein
MSKDITYRCNLCRESSSASGVVGIHFEGGGHSIVPKHAIECENHICKACLSSLSAQMPKLCAFISK